MAADRRSWSGNDFFAPKVPRTGLFAPQVPGRSAQGNALGIRTVYGMAPCKGAAKAACRRWSRDAKRRASSKRIEVKVTNTDLCSHADLEISERNRILPFLVPWW